MKKEKKDTYAVNRKVYEITKMTLKRMHKLGIINQASFGIDLDGKLGSIVIIMNTTDKGICEAKRDGLKGLIKESISLFIPYEELDTYNMVIPNVSVLPSDYDINAAFMALHNQEVIV